MKKVIFYFILFVSALGCSDKEDPKYFVVKGETMGTTYEIAYDSIINLKKEIDFTLGYYNYLLSTYNDSSLISKFNNNLTISAEDSISYINSLDIFKELDSLSQVVYKASGGAFHPGIADLINYWGFGEKRKNPEEVDSALVESLRSVPAQFLIEFEGRNPKKAFEKQRLNFNSIAPGQAVDLIAKMFDSVYHLQNYYINISGEIRVKGNNGEESYWPIKIEKPAYKSVKPAEYCRIPLKNYGLATSGNYRQFYVYKGQQLGHSIDARTGYPGTIVMLSASILAPTAAEADAYATVCMILGPEESKKMIAKNPYLKAFLIYEENQKIVHWASPNLGYTLKK